MNLPLFRLEEFFAKREFNAPFHLSASDAESFSLAELLAMADAESRTLWNDLQLHYTNATGHPLLREEVSSRHIGEVTREHILCFAGAEEGIYCAMHALLRALDHVVVVSPCYQSLESLPASICETTAFSLRYEEGWRLDLGALRRLLRPNTKMIVINFPHNPTGMLLSQKEQQELVELAREHGLWIFSDEVYRLLETDEKNRLPAIVDLYERGVSLNVMSKAYGLGGLRIGWIASRDRLFLERARQVKDYLSICNSAPSEILALIALRAEKSLLARNRALIASNLPLLDKFFEKHSAWFEWVRPQGGCIGYPLFKGKLSVDQLAEDLLRKEGVLLLPGSIYGDIGNHFRIGFGRKNLPEALERLQEYTERNQSHWEQAR